MDGNEIIDTFRGKYFFLSNFYLCNVKFIGLDFPSAEHAYQALKSSDKEEIETILLCDKPSTAKAMGKKIKHLRPGWDNIKVEMMYEIVLAKFKQNHDIARKLIETRGMRIIHENQWKDMFWGTVDGKGLDWLGRILTSVRIKITKEFEKDIPF